LRRNPNFKLRHYPILGNLDECRTEAEISGKDGGLPVAVVYEASDGWHTDIIDKRPIQSRGDFEGAVHLAKEMLSHYVNRRGENAPENPTRGAFALWLLIKDDGTVLGKPLKRGVMS
jgi:hypothetical protein